jgi:cyclic lactone autoinducer peptide
MKRKVLELVTALAAVVASFAVVACFPIYFYQPKTPKSLIKED